MKYITLTVPETASDETYQTICNGFKKHFGNDCKFFKIVNSSILGGFIADVNGEIFDLSVGSMLKQLEKHIVGDTV